MAMLAGPRRRKRYNLVPKGKALFEDNDRFGTKMLEKMGWSKGKGLGAHENGQQDFVRVRYKNDVSGLGFEERDDQWTEHHKHFTGLLETLNSNSNTNSDECDDGTPAFGLGFGAKSTKESMRDKFSGQSLEEKSKSSRARVHYKKFTKGKDISQYSEKDLANIFGKKAEPEDTNIYDQFQAFSVVNEEKPDTEEEPSTTSLINTGISVNDYFKQKMEALKMKRNTNPFGLRKEDEDVKEGKGKKRAIEENEEEQPWKKKKNKSKSKDNEGEEPKAVKENLVEEEPPSQVDHETDIKKTKKKKKIRMEPEGEVEMVQNLDLDDQVPKKKKSKELVKDHELEAETEEISTTNAEQEAITAEGAPKKKKSDVALLLENGTDPAGQVISEVSSKKKKKKRANEVVEESEVSAQYPVESLDNAAEHISPASNPPSPPKSKKDKTKKKSKQPTSSLTEVSQHQDLNQLKDNYYLDTYTISTFCAEKFRNIDLQKFPNSNIAEVNGYALSESLKLNIKTIKEDKQRIMRLWSGTLDKYEHANPKRRVYQTYMTKAREARRAKQKIPPMKVKSLKRKHLFQGL